MGTQREISLHALLQKADQGDLERIHAMALEAASIADNLPQAVQEVVGELSIPNSVV